MNNFDKSFFQKYVPEGHIMKGIIHEHWIKIIDNIFLYLGLFTLVPSFMYYNSSRFQDLVPFYAVEIYLLLIFLKLIYDIFDRYNDVWIITDQGVVDLDRALFSTNMATVKFENIEGVEVEQYGFLDTILNKGDIVIHKIGSDEFRLIDARIPYESIDEIEKVSKEKANSSEKDKFDIVMEALSGVVENYLKEKKIPEKNNKVYKKQLIEKVKLEEGTIDLRK